MNEELFLPIGAGSLNR